MVAETVYDEVVTCDHRYDDDDDDDDYDDDDNG